MHCSYLQTRTIRNLTHKGEDVPVRQDLQLTCESDW